MEFDIELIRLQLGNDFHRYQITEANKDGYFYEILIMNRIDNLSPTPWRFKRFQLRGSFIITIGHDDLFKCTNEIKYLLLNVHKGYIIRFLSI